MNCFFAMLLSSMLDAGLVSQSTVEVVVGEVQAMSGTCDVDLDGDSGGDRSGSSSSPGPRGGSSSSGSSTGNSSTQPSGPQPVTGDRIYNGF